MPIPQTKLCIFLSCRDHLEKKTKFLSRQFPLSVTQKERGPHIHTHFESFPTRGENGHYSERKMTRWFAWTKGTYEFRKQTQTRAGLRMCYVFPTCARPPLGPFRSNMTSNAVWFNHPLPASTPQHLLRLSLQRKQRWSGTGSTRKASHLYHRALDKDLKLSNCHRSGFSPMLRWRRGRKRLVQEVYTVLFFPLDVWLFNLSSDTLWWNTTSKVQNTPLGSTGNTQTCQEMLRDGSYNW